MERTRVETIALIWHLVQMVITLYLIAAPHRVVEGSESGAVAVLMVPAALGWWIAGLLQRPTRTALLLAAIFWLLMAIDVRTSLFSWAFSAGVAIDITFGKRSPVSIDLLAVVTATVFLMAWRGRLTTRSSGP
jgi:hypothetical protein